MKFIDNWIILEDFDLPFIEEIKREVIIQNNLK